MKSDVEQMVDRYVSWLRDKTVLRDVDGEWVEITTPFLDRHNDALQIYTRRRGDKFVLTDDGYTIEDLQQSGCKLDSPKRQAMLKSTLAGFGVRNADNRLEVDASADNFGLRKHSLLQAMLAVNDLFYLAMPTVASLFREDVTAWLDGQDIRYTPEVTFTGKSGYDHRFDFVIPKSRQQPERILQTLPRPTKDAAVALAFKWIDTKDVRPADSMAYALVNDMEQSIPMPVSEALQRYDVEVVPWSRRHEAAEELAA